ncbi:hypothetical protein [Caulobacter sp. 3R27C2-B]|jgi:hypothetical protein|uniref:hypothetical protein n=1 Tax=Caulobacter sp. 3R27C2-B TaxID=2502219 RepID=UPI001484FC77|nr:hypothetical protein [Caulobacter sp. 3R27C2-B]
MLSEAECRSRADEWDRRRLDCNDEALRREITIVAQTWQYLALQAAWQDAYIVDPL